MKKKNVIFRDSDFFNVSGGKTRHSGLEASLYYQLSPQWDMATSISVARHRYDYHRILNNVDIHNNDIDSAPGHFANSRLGWQPNEQLRLELEWQRLGSYYTDPENLHRYEGHDLLHTNLSYQYTPALTLSLRANNFTNRDYAERADYTGFSGERYFPGRGRTLYLGVDYQW